MATRRPKRPVDDVDVEVDVGEDELDPHDATDDTYGGGPLWAGGPSFLRAMRLLPDAPRSGFPYELPSVQALDQIAFGSVTILVGDNGSGKSTIVEGLAVASGFNPEGGSRNLMFETYDSHSRLHEHLRLSWRTRPKHGWFLRAESFYGMATHINTDDPVDGVKGLFPDYHVMSHGESFLSTAGRFGRTGFYILDEPESALSLQGQLKLMATMYNALAAGSQFVIATHSPVLMAYPGAAIFELSRSGIEAVDYDDVVAIGLWRRFLGDPQAFLARIFEVDADRDPDPGSEVDSDSDSDSDSNR